MNVEAVLLTGGGSRRMGEDKAGLLIEGTPLSRRIAEAFRSVGIPVTILGREPLVGYAFLPDSEAGAGPLVALSHFRPAADLAMVCACDLPRFDPRLVKTLLAHIGAHEAAIPFADGWRQPLCALYRREAWDKLPAAMLGPKSGVLRWVDSLDHVVVDDRALTEAGLDPRCVQGANSKAELRALLEP